jgi:valyl-tRNA synthetase
MLAAYPEGQSELIDENAELEMQMLIDIVSRVRNIRSEMSIKPGRQVDVLIETGDGQMVAIEIKQKIERLTRSQVLDQQRATWPKATAFAVVAGGGSVGIPLEGLIDFEQERQRLGKEKEKLSAESAKLEAQLANPQFAERAPFEKVEEVRARIADIAQRNAQLDQTIANLA